MRIVALSDTHGHHDAIAVPDGDVLFHAGDMTNRGTLRELERFAGWWHALPHRQKVSIAGNHDFCFEREVNEARALLAGTHYLEDQALEIDGVRFFGSPWQPWFFGWAFNLERGEHLADKWRAIPDDTDVLLTHGPPMSILDKTWSGEHVGCADLFERVQELSPQLHVFGHIHESYGLEERDGTIFANAASCTLSHKATNAPWVFDLVRGP